MVIKMIVIMNMLRLIRKMLMVLVIFVYDYTPGRPKIAHCLPRGGPKISHDKVKLDSDLLIGKSMLLAAATATRSFSSVIAMCFIDTSVFNW